MIVLIDNDRLKLLAETSESDCKVSRLSQFKSSSSGGPCCCNNVCDKAWFCMENSSSHIIEPNQQYIMISLPSPKNEESVSTALLKNPHIILVGFFEEGAQFKFQLNPHRNSPATIIICIYERSAAFTSVIHPSGDLSSCNISNMIISTFCRCTHQSCNPNTKISPTAASVKFEQLRVLGESFESCRYIKQIKQEYQNLVLTQHRYCPCVNDFRKKTVLFQKCMDMFIGFLMVWLIFVSVENINQTFQVHVQVVVNATVRLLDALMNNPGGLKLNHGLAIFLGKFYTYHVWLWAEYIKLLVSYSTPVLKALVLIGCCGGFTFQIALLQDLISILTMHLVCFYIYSARLYRLCTSSMIMLWRLFRGKKWNVLRERVDSAEYDLEQLFIGTLFFTVALFLMPTVLVYYLVFGSFYIVLSFVHIVMTQIQHLVRYNYLLVHILLLLRSPQLTTRGSLEIIENEDSDLTVLKYDKLKMASYREVVQVLQLTQSKQPTSLTDVLKGFISGTTLAPAATT